MVDHPSRRPQQPHYHGQPSAGPSSNNPRTTSTLVTPINSSGYKPSDTPRFWTSTSLRTTYASYKSNPGAWKDNYLSTVDDFKAFSFGRPNAAVIDEEDKRWKIAMREGDETSSSSSDDGESRRRRGGRSRDITPRASVVSLDVSFSHPDTNARSHPSQLQQINYYHRGVEDSGSRDMAYHHQADHLHPFELQEPNSDDEMRGGIRSDGSIYSHDTGYDAASSYRSGSGTGSYAPSYTSSYTRARAELEAEAISISSSRPASSAASGMDPTLERHYDHDDLSISSTRRSSLFDEQGERYDEDDPIDYLYDALLRSNPGSGASSNMHLSVSSLRFDGRDEYLDEYEPAKDSAAPSILPAGITPSTSATPALIPPSPASAYVSDTHNTLDDFDLTYITSGLALSANAMSEDSHMPDAALDDLDFVRKRPIIESVGEQRLEGDTQAALVKRPQRGVPMGWEDDLSIPTLFSDVTTEGSRARQATTIAAANLAGGVSSALPRMSTVTAGASDASGSTQDTPRGPSAQRDLTAILDQSEINSANGMPNTVQLHASSVSSPSFTPPSFPGSLSNLENVSGTNSSGIVENKNTIRRKRSIFAGLGTLGIGSVNSSSSRTKEAQAETSQTMSPVSPVSPVSPARTIKGEGQRMDLNWGKSNAGESSVDASAIPGGPSVPLVLDSSMVTSPSMDLSTTHHSFAYNDSLARPLVVRGGPDSAGVRREWVIRKEVHSNLGEEGKPEIVKTGKDSGIKSEQKKDKDKADALTGMLIGTDEVWENFLLGKFHVVRDDMSPRIGKVNSDEPNGNVKFVNGGGDKGTEGNVLGFRVPLGKPPQQRLIIKHLREDNKSQVGHPVAIDPSKRQTKLPDLTVYTVPENPPSLSVSYQALHSQHAAGSSHSSTSNTNSATIATSNLQPLRHDSHYPSILVHKHSKVAAFSINRQYRATSKESKESSSGRMRVVMLAPRDIQEAFTNTATTKKLGTVIDRHEAARVAFSPGHDQTVTDKKGKTKMKKHSSIYISSFKGKHRPSDGAPQVKSEGQIVLDHLDIENQYLRQSTSKPSVLAKNTGSVRDKVGTQSAPTYDRSYELITPRVGYDGVDLGNKEHKEFGLSDQGVNEGGQHIRIRTQHEPQSRENYKRTYGTLAHPPHSFGNFSSVPPASSRPSRILKRLIPWDLSSPSVSTAVHGSSSKATSSTGSTSTMTRSASTRDTTPTQSAGSDISIPYDPPWVTFASREQQEIQRNVLGRLEYSFEHVGLLPPKDKDVDRERSRTNNTVKEGLHELNVGSIIPKLHKKNDILSPVPADAFFMLLPLWPADTDIHSQRLSPFDIPSIPAESRKYLLIFYKSLQVEQSSKGSSIYDSRLKILLPGFRAIARQVSYPELQGTGIRIPEQGISVNGPLEDAFTQMPGLRDTGSGSGLGTSPSVPVSDSQLCVIASCYSRDVGLEFDPEALIELGLCRILGSKGDTNPDEKNSLPVRMDEEQFDAERSMTVKLTPIGNAVMEMVWVGGLALTSFGS